MKTHAFIATFLLGAFVQYTSSAPVSLRIADGRRALPDVLQYMAAIGDDGHEDSYCSGSVIGTRWILSAAHCFLAKDATEKNSTAEEVHVYVGIAKNIKQTDASKKRAVKALYIHKDYTMKDGGTMFNDIAVLELKEDITDGSIVQLVDAPAETTEDGKVVIIAGYGSINDDTEQSSRWARQAPVAYLNYDTCLANDNDHKDGVNVKREFNACALPNGVEDWYTYDTESDDETDDEVRQSVRMNAQGEGNLLNTGICGGDSGGPVFIREPGRVFKQFGIIAFGPDCGEHDSPMWFEKLDTYRSDLASLMSGTVPSYFNVVQEESDYDYDDDDSDDE